MKCKNCKHEIEKIGDNKDSIWCHKDRFYMGKAGHSKEYCRTDDNKKHKWGKFLQPEYCGCVNPEPEKEVLK